MVELEGHIVKFSFEMQKRVLKLPYGQLTALFCFVWNCTKGIEQNGPLKSIR